MTTATPSATPGATKKKVSLIDTDVHNAVRDWAQLAKHLPAGLRKRGQIGPGGLGFSNPFGVDRADAIPPGGGKPGSDPAHMAAHHLDAYGIDFAVLTPANLMGMGVSADYRYAAAVCSAYNDYLIEHWLEADPRYLGAALIAPQWPEAAAAEIRRVGGHPRIVQVVSTSAARIPYGNAIYWPIYEACAEMGLPYSVHPGHEGSGISGAPTPAGHPSSYFEWHTDLSQNYMAHVTSLVIEGVFEQFPSLKFIAIEGGVGWLPHLMWRMDKNWKALRELTPWLKRAPSEYILDHVRLTSQPIEEPEDPRHLLQIFEMMHADRVLMFSSDYPHWDFDSPKHAFPKLPPDLAERIFFRNALELYGLPEER